MKLRKILMGLAAVVGFTTAATAATPVAVWDGDFTTATKSGWTIAENGNTKTDTSITIVAGKKGVLVTPDAAKATQTVIVRYSDLARPEANNGYVLGTVAKWNVTDANQDYVGTASVGTDGKAYGLFQTKYWHNSNTVQTQAVVPQSGKFGLSYDRAVKTQLMGSSGLYYSATGLKSSNDTGATFAGFTIGGMRYTVTTTNSGYIYSPAAGMVITGIAVFESTLSQAEVEAYQFPSEIKEYYATLDGHVYEWTDLDGKWNPKPPAEGFSATDTLVITNEANQSFFMDKDVTALKLKFVSSPDAPALQLTADEEVSLAIGTYDFSEAESKTTIKYEMTASVVAGKDTVLEKANNPSLTIAEGNKLTVKNGSLTASKVSNAGTLHFMGGTAADPIYIDGGVAAGLGTITLAENTYVKQDDKETTTKYNVTGSGATSFFTVARKGTGAPGMQAGSSFADVIVGSAATASGKEYWLEHATIADTVGLNLTGNLKLSDLTPNPVVIRSLTGTYNLAVNDQKPVSLTICCKEDANFAGTSGLPITIGEGEGTQTFSGAFNKALTVEEGGKVKLTGSAQPASIAVAGTVTVDPNGAAKTITGTITGAGDIIVHDSSAGANGSAAFTGNLTGFTGTITYENGSFDIGTERTKPELPSYVVLESGVTFAATQSSAEYAQGLASEFTGFTEGQTIKLNKLDGTTEELTVDEEGKAASEASGEIHIDGPATYADATFTNATSATKKPYTASLSYASVADLGLQYDSAVTTNAAGTGAYLKHHPWIRNLPNSFMSGSEMTVAVVGEMSPSNNTMFIHFGDTTGSKKGIFLATGSKEDEVVVKMNTGITLTDITTMTVPHAATARHVYIITKSDDSTHTTVSVYLDGTPWKTVVLDKMTLSGGVQCGSDYGGALKEHNPPIVNPVGDDDTALINVMRIYDRVISKAEIDAYSDAYPYVSKSGTSSRTFTDAAEDWIAEESATCWSFKKTAESEAVLTNAPVASSTIEINGTADVTTAVSVNLDEDAHQDGVNISSPGAFKFAKVAGKEGQIISGLTQIGCPVEIEYGSLDISGAPLTLIDQGAITFDLSGFDLSTYFAGATIPMTGDVAQDDEKITAINIPESEGREATFGYNGTQYVLTITVDDDPFVYNMGWTWNDEDVTAETVSNNTAQAIIVQSNLEWPIDRSGITVEAGTLTATAVTKRAADVTVEADAVLDLDGNNAKEMALTLNGGKVTNGGAAITGSDQIKTITLDGDSEINVPNAYEIYAVNYDTATTIDLGEDTLTKTGEAQLKLVKTIISNGVFYVSEGTVYSGESTTFEEDATLKIGENGTWEQRNGARKTTVSKIVGEGGTLKIEGQISNFTLEGTLTVTGNGTFGTITNAAGAVVNVGQKRGLVFAGAGTVNVTLTDAEYEAGQVTLFTLADEATTAVGTVMYNDEDITEKCTISGGQITAIAKDEAKIGDVYYPTLAAALDAAEAEDEIELLKDVAFTPNGKYTLDKTIYLTLGGFNLTGNGGTTFEVVNGASFYVTATDSTVSALRINVGRATNDNGNLFVNGGTWTIDNNAIIHVNGTCKNCWVTTQDADFTSNGDNAIQFCGAGTFSIDGGTITGATAVYVKAGTLSIAADLVANGEKTPYVYSANGANATGDALVIDNCGYPEGPATVSLLAGTTLTSAHAEKMGYYVYNSSPEGTVTKDASVDVNTPEGYLWKDGTTLTKAEAKIGTTYYLTFAEALEAAQADDTVTLCKDITTAEKAAFTIDKSITLDFATFTVEKTVANDYTFDVTTNVTVTFTGTTGGVKQTQTAKNPNYPASMIRNKGDLTIAGGVYTSDFCIIKNDEDPGAGTLTVNGGTFNIVEPVQGFKDIQMALMNWSTATINGGTWNGGTICTRSCDGNKVSKAGTTEITTTLEGTAKCLLLVGYPGDTTYENVPKIKGVDIVDVELKQVSTITDELELVEKDGYVTVQKKSGGTEVVPGEPVHCDTLLEANKVTIALDDKQKAMTQEQQDAYTNLFTKVIIGSQKTGYTVSFLPTEDTVTSVSNAVVEADKELLSEITPGETVEVSIATKPGLYYSVGVSETLSTEELVKGEGDRTMGTGEPLDLEVTTPEEATKCFYQIMVNVTDKKVGEAK